MKIRVLAFVAFAIAPAVSVAADPATAFTAEQQAAADAYLAFYCPTEEKQAASEAQKQDMVAQSYALSRQEAALGIDDLVQAKFRECLAAFESAHSGKYHLPKGEFLRRMAPPNLKFPSPDNKGTSR